VRRSVDDETNAVRPYAEAEVPAGAHALNVFGAVAIPSEVFNGSVSLLSILPGQDPHEAGASLISPKNSQSFQPAPDARRAASSAVTDSPDTKACGFANAAATASRSSSVSGSSERGALASAAKSGCSSSTDSTRAAASLGDMPSSLAQAQGGEHSSGGFGGEAQPRGRSPLVPERVPAPEGRGARRVTCPSESGSRAETAASGGSSNTPRTWPPRRSNGEPASNDPSNLAPVPPKVLATPAGLRAWAQPRGRAAWPSLRAGTRPMRPSACRTGHRRRRR
jgi:hypothetical protein